MIQEYHQTLKSNIRIMQTEIMKDYTFSQVGAIMLLQLFPKKQLDFPPISAFDTLMILAEITKIATYPATASKRHFLL